MKSSLKRLFAVSLAVLMAVSAAACTQSAPSSTPAASTPAASTPAASGDSASADSDAPVYPLDTDVKLTWWMPMASNYTTYATNFAEIEFAKNFHAAVGIDVEYVQPPIGKEQEQFNIMVASGDLTDIIEQRWTTEYPGGSMGAISDGIILDITDLIAEHAPNYTAYLAERPSFVKEVVTDEGRHYCFPFVRGSAKLKTTSGPILRKDWLDDLGLEIPVTIADWENVLTQFKDQKGATAPFFGQAANQDPSQLYNTFLGAYGVRTDFFVDTDNDTIKYGYIEPGFKDFLITMNDWANKGLLDPNFLSADRAAMDAAILNGAAGAVYGPGGGGLGPWITTAREADASTTFDLAATTFPVLNAGDPIKYAGTSYDYAITSRGSAAITTKCKEVEVAVKVLDYAYSEEGNILYNFGVEGESFTFVDGVPTYTELVTANPNGLNFAQALSNYTRANVSGPFEQHEQYIIQFYAMDQQKDALDKWTTQDPMNMYTLEPPISMTPEESSEITKLIADINTYRREMVAKFLTGAESLDKFDDFVAQMNALGAQRCIEIHQAAYDRYIQR